MCGELGQVGENAGVRQGGRERSGLLWRNVNETLNFSLVIVSKQDFTVSRVYSECDNSRVGDEPPNRAQVGSFMTQRPDTSGAIIAKNVGSVELGELRATINEAANDTSPTVAARAVGVRIQRAGEKRIGRRNQPICRAFLVRPSVIATGHNQIDFFPVDRAHVSAIEPTARWIEGHAPGVAEANGIKLRPNLVGIDRIAVMAGRANKWIIRRNRIIGRVARMRVGWQAAGPFVHVQSKNTAEKTLVDGLRIVGPVTRRRGLVAQ